MFPIDHLDRKPLGSTKELISAIGIGTYGIGNEHKAIETLKYAVEVGLDLVDTAEMYASGGAEKLIGEVLREVGRSRLFVVTKLYPYRFRSPEESIRALKTSLKRLGTSYVDLVLIHWPDTFTPIEQQIRSLETLADNGLSRYIGVSNFTAEQLKKALISTAKHDIVVNQVKYSVIDRCVEKDLLPFCIKSKVTIMAYTPLERGRVINIRRLNETALKYGKTPIQVALNFIISRPNVVAMPKTERKERIEEFKGALGWRLSDKDINLLEELNSLDF
ncbi:MAG: aldo/keto reductase [Candidatus Bathyarchaeia archaeon]